MGDEIEERRKAENLSFSKMKIVEYITNW